MIIIHRVLNTRRSGAEFHGDIKFEIMKLMHNFQAKLEKRNKKHLNWKVTIDRKNTSLSFTVNSSWFEEMTTLYLSIYLCIAIALSVRLFSTVLKVDGW